MKLSPQYWLQCRRNGEQATAPTRYKTLRRPAGSEGPVFQSLDTTVADESCEGLGDTLLDLLAPALEATRQSSGIHRAVG